MPTLQVALNIATVLALSPTIRGGRAINRLDSRYISPEPPLACTNNTIFCLTCVGAKDWLCLASNLRPMRRRQSADGE